MLAVGPGAARPPGAAQADQPTAAAPAPVRAGHFFQAIAHRAQVAELRRVLHRLETDRPFRAFHEGKSVPLPEFDHRRFERRLGRFAGLVSRADRVPVLEATAPGLRSR